MFAEQYRRAYDEVTPSQEMVAAVLRQAREAQTLRKNGEVSYVEEALIGETRVGCRMKQDIRRCREKEDIRRSRGTEYARKGRIWRRSVIITAAVILVASLGLFTALPVCAAHIPAFYRVIEYLSPALADRLIPVEKSSSSQGITMEVEAVDLQADMAEIIVSVRADEGSAFDRIHGPVDLFDSYHLTGFASSHVSGGCHFLTYDEETGRAYFKVTVQTDGADWSEKLRFSVREILCNKTKERRTIDLSDVHESVETRLVRLSGTGGMMEEADLPDSLKRVSSTQEDPIGQQAVLDLMAVEDCSADDFTVTGAAYIDGVLRMQICMGDTHHADRHVEEFLVDAAGNEQHADYSVSWQEEIGDTSYQFYEYWFIDKIEDVEDLGNYTMYGVFHNSGESVEGQWEVTFRVE